MKNEDKKPDRLKLPERLVTPVDLARITRELRMLDEWLSQAALRTPGAAITPPKTTVTLEELATINGVSLLEQPQRQQLLDILTKFAEKAPKIHMSFAVEPSAVFLERMIVWLRSNISPLILLQVGLQPTLAAGCTVRTTNKMFDLSLRHRFVDSRPMLVKSIEAITKDMPAPELASAGASTEVAPAATATTELPAEAAPAQPSAPVSTAPAAEAPAPPAEPAPPAPVTEKSETQEAAK